MRIHADHPLAHYVAVTLDGQPVETAFFADEEAGVVLLVDTTCSWADRSHHWAWRARTGKVEIQRQEGFAERAAELELDENGEPLP